MSYGSAIPDLSDGPMMIELPPAANIGLVYDCRQKVDAEYEPVKPS